MGFDLIRMPLIAAFVSLLIMASGDARAADLPPPSEHDGIQSVIRSQLDAFRRDDAGAAFSIASPSIQRIFGNPANFLAMVQTGYPQVYRHRRAEFGELSVVRGELVQPVVFTGMDGHKALALYSIIKDSSGTWRISGCRLVQKGEAGA